MPAPRRYRNISGLPAVIPIFPLTGVILLPRTKLPLNVFEPRYLAMVDAAMDHDRVIGMIQPRVPGSEKGQKPALSSIGCLGRITDYSETYDGRYHITLSGIARFHVSREVDSNKPFREVAADYALFAEDLLSTEDPPIGRDRLLGALKPYLSDRALETDWKSIEEAPSETLVNALCMLCPFEPSEKQALLEAPDFVRRSETLTALLEMANASATPSGGSPSLN